MTNLLRKLDVSEKSRNLFLDESSQEKFMKFGKKFRTSLNYYMSALRFNIRPNPPSCAHSTGRQSGLAART